MAMIFCRGCGKEIHESAPMCPHCGAPNAPSTPAVDATIPDGVKGFSWGAFLLNWVWSIGNRTWVGLLCLLPVVGFVMAFVLGFKGREWAWKNARWDSLEHFNRVQRLWTIWALILVFGVGGIGMIAAIALPAYQDYTTRAKTSEVLASMMGPKTALGERLQESPEGKLLTDLEIKQIKESVITSKYVSDVNFYALAKYADVVSTVKINDKEGHIYFYTQDGGQTWVCGSEDFPVRFLPMSCRDTAGFERPVPPVEKPKQTGLGLWDRNFAVGFHANCVVAMKENLSEMAEPYCQCIASHVSEVIDQQTMALDVSAESRAALTDAVQACTKELALQTSEEASTPVETAE